MRASEGLILSLAIFIVQKVPCRSTCSTGGTKFEDVASRTIVAGVVFEGKMLAPVQVSNPLKLHAVRFKVDKLVKGDLPKDFQSVVVGAGIANGQADCLQNLRSKRRYIVFLSLATEMIDDFTVYRISGPPEEYSSKAAKDAAEHVCRNCAQRPTARLSPRKVSAEVGSNVTLRCTAKGRPLPVISWFKNDQPLSSSNSERLVIRSQKTSSVLMIRSAKAEDGANYWCQAANVLATSNSSTVTVKIRKGDSVPDNLKELGKECPVQTFCLNGGTCHLLPDNGFRYCVCAPSYTGPRCQDRRSKLEVDKVNVQTSNTDKALVFVGLFLTLLILVTLVAVLYCITRLRCELNSREKQFVNEITARSPFRSEPPFVNQKVEHMFIQPTVHITEDNKLYARRQRLSAVSSIVEADPYVGQNLRRPSYEETEHRSKRMPSSRVSTSSSNQGLLLTEDDIDGVLGKTINTKKSDPRLEKCCQPVRCTLVTCSSTATPPDLTVRPLSSHSNYENQRLGASCDRLSSRRGKNFCTSGSIVSSSDHPEMRKQSVEFQPDVNSREAREEVNNLLKELGVYLPEDGSD